MTSKSLDGRVEHADIVIVGAGQAGLASAYAAQRAGLRPVVLEAGDAPTGSWPRFYESLVLFSPARYSGLPGRPMPGDPERYPTRDELAAYLRDYADWLAADIRTGQRVDRVATLDGGGFEVETDAGLALRAPYLIAASGGFGTPHRPRLPGRQDYRGEILHAADYRRPDGYAGKRVIVVGGGDSAVQIAHEIAVVARVTLATRSPLRWQPQRPLGRDIHWWLDRTGFDGAPLGRLLHAVRTAVVDDGRYRAALAAGAYDRRPMFARLAGDGVVWADGAVEPVDVVLLATGYRPSLGYLAGTGALGPDGAPLHRSGESRTVPGLAYVGLEFQRSFRSATVRGVGADAQRVVERLTSASRWQATGRPRRRRRLLAAVREEANGPAGRGAGGPAVQQGRP